MDKFKYIKNIYRDKANTFHQDRLEPVEYQDGGMYMGGVKSSKPIKRRPKPKKSTNEVFGSNDDIFEY